MCLALAVGALAASSPRARADTFAFQAYPTDTLPSRDVKTMFQDREGLLWLGTELGLVRYDGASFEPNDEVDVVRWLPGSQALEVLTYDRDQAVLAAAIEAAR